MLSQTSTRSCSKYWFPSQGKHIRSSRNWGWSPSPPPDRFPLYFSRIHVSCGLFIYRLQFKIISSSACPDTGVMRSMWEALDLHKRCNNQISRPWRTYSTLRHWRNRPLPPCGSGYSMIGESDFTSGLITGDVTIRILTWVGCFIAYQRLTVPLIAILLIVGIQQCKDSQLRF
jgi:hypothetical protein